MLCKQIGAKSTGRKSAPDSCSLDLAQKPVKGHLVFLLALAAYKYA